MKKPTLTEQLLLICILIVFIVIISLGVILPRTLLPVYEENLYNHLNESLNIIDTLTKRKINSEIAYIYIDSDGTVQLKVTESQKNTLIENMNQYLSSVSEQFKNLGDGYDISWNTDFSEISYKFDSALSKQDQSNYFTYTETIGMLNQLLKGDSNSYYIDLSIYNSSSGELVSKGNTKDGITWNIGE